MLSLIFLANFVMEENMRKILSLFACFIAVMSVHTTAFAESSFGLQTSYHVDTVWATAYQVTVKLSNTTTTATSSWKATFSLPQSYALSAHLWNGVFSVNGQNVTVNNPSGKGVISPGGSTTFSMIINMPQSSPTIINNLQANGNTSQQPPPPSAPLPPVLKSISSPTNQSYTVSWNSVNNATSYSLEQDTAASFSHPQVVAQGNLLSKAFTNQSPGTYYYRVAASNSVGKSPYSNVQSVSVTQVNPPPTTSAIEHSVWYIDWTSWFTGPTFVIPSGVNMLNVFVGELAYDANGNPTMDGFGTFTLSQLDAFTAYCAAQQPPIAVKVSIGGAGGMYDHTWDKLTSTNVQTFAQGMVNFCHAHGLAGVDFDYEEFASADQETLVGNLIKAFKIIDPKLQTSLCTNAGFGPNFPWQQVVQNIMDAALIAPGNCALDRLYIMSYYDPIQNEQAWINGWANWVAQRYGFTPARVSVGIDDFDAHAYDPVQMANWAASMGYSTAHWAFDPAHP